MVKYVLLVPLTYNDGKAVPQEVLDKIFGSVYELAGGYYLAGTGEGAYKMANGSKQLDICLQIWVVLDETCVEKFISLVRSFAALLQQETMYVEKVVSEVQFVG